MKQLFYFVILFCVSFTIGCSSDDDSGSQSSNELIGKWNLSSFTYQGESISSSIAGTITTTFSGKAINIDSWMDLAEPNLSTAGGSYDIELTSTTLGVTQTQVVDATNGALPVSGTWARNGNTLTFTANGSTQDYTIVELTNSRLEISTSISATTTDISGTTMSTSDLNAVYTK